MKGRKHTRTVFIAAALFLGSALPAAADQGSQQGGVTVFRGNQASVESARGLQREQKARVAIQRGAPLVIRQAPKPAADPARYVVTGGEEIWVLDPESGRLIGCQLNQSVTVGRNEIDCAKASLAAALR